MRSHAVQSAKLSALLFARARLRSTCAACVRLLEFSSSLACCVYARTQTSRAKQIQLGELRAQAKVQARARDHPFSAFQLIRDHQRHTSAGRRTITVEQANERDRERERTAERERDKDSQRDSKPAILARLDARLSGQVRSAIVQT